jgi:hypothetical protein
MFRSFGTRGAKVVCTFPQLNGLSPNGLWNGVSFFFDPPSGGGSIGGVVIITREIELSRTTLKTSGLIYVFLGNIFRLMVFNCK